MTDYADRKKYLALMHDARQHGVGPLVDALRWALPILEVEHERLKSEEME